MKEIIKEIKKAKNEYSDFLKIAEMSESKYGYIKGRDELIIKYKENIQKLDKVIKILREIK